MDNAAKLMDVKAIRAYLLAGKATITVKNVAKGTHLTFNVKRADGDKPSRPYFVSVLSADDHYRYMGCIWPGSETRSPQFTRTKNSKISSDAPSMKGFSFLMKCLTIGVLPPALEVWHIGKCGCCGRALTVPESIASGIGPICAKKAAA